MNFSPAEDPKPEINMVPLVDIVLQLVIFFMVTTSFALQFGLEVNLPQTAPQELKEPATVTLTLTKEHKLYLNREPLTLEGLPQALTNLKLPAGGRSLLIIRADREVQHGEVVRIMDLAKSAGIGRLAIATEPMAQP